MKKIILAAVLSVGTQCVMGQNKGGNLTGNVESIFQYLNEDTLIGADQPDSKGLMNTYMNVFYTHGNFKGGMRIESYLPRIQGYPKGFLIKENYSQSYKQIGNSVSVPVIKAVANKIVAVL